MVRFVLRGALGLALVAAVGCGGEDDATAGGSGGGGAGGGAEGGGVGGSAGGAGGGGAGGAAGAGPVGWREEPPLATVLQEHAVAAHQGRIAVVGGFEGIRMLRTLRLFDPATGVWTEGPELPADLHHTHLVSTGPDLYVVGGEVTLEFRPIDSAWVLRDGATAWEGIAPLPEPRGAGVAGFVGGRIVVAGGLGESGLGADTLLYDPAQGTWSRGAAIPTRREHLTGVVHADRLWAFGGRLGGLDETLDATERYDPATDTWEAAAALPTARGGIAAGVLGGVAYVMGGETPTFVHDLVEAFDLAAGTWSTSAPLTTPRHGFGAAVLGGRLYAVAGADRPTFGAIATVESYRP